MSSALLPDSVFLRAVLPERSMEPSWPTLLFVDSDLTLSRTLVCHFERRGFHVATAATLTEARDYLHRRKRWTLVIADCHLPDGTGWELQTWCHDQGQRTPFLLVSSSPFSATMCAGSDFLAKPFSLAMIEARVNRLTGK